jgi:hypothetical protein
VNNLKQINLGLRMYAEEFNNLLPATTNVGTPSVWSAYENSTRGYMGLRGNPSPQDVVFACPSDTFYYDFDDRISQPHHLQFKYNYSSYAFNAGNIPPGEPPVHPWPGIAGWNMNSVKEPVKTVLVAEFPTLLPYSWHQSSPSGHFNNAPNVVSFVDSHISYIKIYWDANNAVMGHNEAWHYNPPAGYQYKWSPD